MSKKQTLNEMITDLIIAESEQRQDDAEFWQIEIFQNAKPTVQPPAYEPEQYFSEVHFD